MHPIGVHEIDYLAIPWDIHQHDPSASNLAPEHYLEIARKWWGSEEAADQTHYRGNVITSYSIHYTKLYDQVQLDQLVGELGLAGFHRAA